MTESAALAKVYCDIVRMSSQCPSSQKRDFHRIRLTRRAVCNKPWSHLALQRFESAGLSSQQLYEELKSTLQLYRESTNVSTPMATASSNRKAFVYYTGQGRYKRRNFTHQFKKPWKRKSPLDIVGCFSCDDRGHMALDWHKPLNRPKAVEKK